MPGKPNAFSLLIQYLQTKIALENRVSLETASAVGQQVPVVH